MTRARTLSLLGNENNFTVTGSNNVGIGSTLPDGKLDVGGDIVVGTAITISSVSGIISATDFYVDGVSITGAAGTWATFTSGGEGGISTTKKVKIENGLEVTGISTFSGDLTVGGVLTYDDVTNVDSIGIITARSGLRATSAVVGGGVTVTGVGELVVSQSTQGQSATLFLGKGGNSKTFAVSDAGQVKIGSNLDSASTTNITLNADGSADFAGDISIADKIIHTGDTNTAIRFPAADTFTVETAGAEVLRVTSAGRVGVGTADPSFNMTVAGSSNPRIEIEALDNSSAGLFINTKSGGAIVAQSTIRTDNDGRLQIFVGRTSESLRFQLDEAGNVNASGICTATSFSGDGSGLSGVSGYNDLDNALFG